MEKLALEIFDRDGGGSKFANLPDDTSITITDTSEVFDSGDIWSHSFTLNVFANPHLFGSTGDIHGGRLHEQIDGRRARLWVEGLALYYGYLRLDDEVDIEDNGDVDVRMESGQKTFEKMIEGAKANQVPIPDDIMIGMAVDRERTLELNETYLQFAGKNIIPGGNYPFSGGVLDAYYETVDLTGEPGFAQMFPKFVRPDGTWIEYGVGTSETITRNMTINTDHAYGEGHPYCNTWICYQKKKFENNNGTLEAKATREYKLCAARRINPAPNFYVLYWLDILMKHLNIHIEENQLPDVEDLKRLFFVNTKCAYKVDKTTGYSGNYMPFGNGNPLIPENETDNPWSKVEVESVEGTLPEDFVAVLFKPGMTMRDPVWHKAYATSDNFPDVDIKDVIEAIENGFGVRMMFSADYTRVRIVLLRNIFRSQDVQNIECDVTEVTKQENSIRGFRLTYGGSEDDTNFVYKGFELAKKKEEGGWLTEEDTHDYSQFDTSIGYSVIKDSKVTTLNKTCYIDSTTGNAYIIKIDKDAKSAADQFNPSLFECAPFMDAEDGDCTGEEETIKEVRIGFSPMVMNTIGPGQYALYVSEEMNVSSEEPETGFGINTTPEEILSKMEGSLSSANLRSSVKQEKQYRNGLFEVATATTFKASKGTGPAYSEIIRYRIKVNGENQWYGVKVTGYVREGYRLYLQDNYELNDEMECPLEKHDWGLTLGIMRGTNAGPEDSTVKYEIDVDDNEGNDTWEIEPGSVFTAHSDTCDDDGNPWDYRPTVQATGEEYGDWKISEAGFVNQCNLKTRKGPKPWSTDAITGLIDTYLTQSGYMIWVVNEQGFYITHALIEDASGTSHKVRLSCVKNGGELVSYDAILAYIDWLGNSSANAAAILSKDAAGTTVSYNNGSTKALQNMILAIDYDTSTIDSIISSACEAYANGGTYAIPQGEQTEQTGLVSLKLRAEKPNPYFDPNQPENNTTNRRYLEITTPSLKHRGLADQFYKEYSYWVRNARIAKMKVRMELAQLLGIDKTKRVKIGDITGFIKKMQFSVHIQTGMSDVTVEMLYL